MKKEIRYTYLGTNGIIESAVHLEDTYYIRKIRLTAAPGKKLTKDGKTFCQSATVPEQDVELWYEVDAKK